MTGFPKASVIVTTHNINRYISIRLPSAAAQIPYHLEIRFVDEGPASTTPQIDFGLVVRDPRIKPSMFCDSTTGRVAPTANEGMDATSSGFMDDTDNDCYVPDVFEALRRAATGTNSNPAMCDCTSLGEGRSAVMKPNESILWRSHREVRLVFI